MGGGQSVRETHFQRPQHTKEDVEDMQDDHHISISNKMVERLVEDAAIAGAGAAATPPAVTPRGDYKDQLYMERLRCMDDNHSERTGLRIDDVNALINSIDLRTANMVNTEPVCADVKQRVIDCYNTYMLPEENFKCWETVGAFTQCVQETRSIRLRARTQRDARDHARLSRQMALARENELRDLSMLKVKDLPAGDQL